MDISGYSYGSAAAEHTHAYLWKPALKAVHSALAEAKTPRILDLGCGSGSFASTLADRGFTVTGVDPSKSGIEIAREAFPRVQFAIASTEDDLAGRFGQFHAVTSLEVIEHVFAPRQYAQRVYDLLEPGGTAIISTPYNGYLKNLAIALLGKFDRHHTALWDCGHIKFWSINTLSQLLTEAGFTDIKFIRVGRIPVLAKSMIAIARKPA